MNQIREVLVTLSAPELADVVIAACPQKISPKHKIYELARRCADREIRYCVKLDYWGQPTHTRIKYNEQKGTYTFIVQSFTRDEMTPEACPQCQYSLSCQLFKLERRDCRCGGHWLLQFPKESKQWLPREDRICTFLPLPNHDTCPAPQINTAVCPHCISTNVRSRAHLAFQQTYSRNIVSFKWLLGSLLKIKSDPAPALGGTLENGIYPWRIADDRWHIG